MTRRAERDQVVQPIRFAVVIEQSEWPDVVDLRPFATAPLTDCRVPRSGLAALCLPVRSAVALRPAKVLWVQLADPIPVTTSPRAVTATAPSMIRVAGCPTVRCPASHADQLHVLVLLLANGHVLTGTRTRPTSPPLQSRGPHVERLATGLATNGHAAPRRHCGQSSACRPSSGRWT